MRVKDSDFHESNNMWLLESSRTYNTALSWGDVLVVDDEARLGFAETLGFCSG